MRRFLGVSTVTYEKGDHIGKLLALVTLSPIYVVSGLFCVFLCRREVHTASIFCGVLVSTLLNNVVKMAIKEPRPTGTERQDEDDYGMPSDHSQFMFFCAVYLTLCILVRGMFVRRFRVWVCLVIYLYSALVAFSRFYLGYHTPNQIYAGCALGGVLGVVWYVFTWGVLKPFVFPWVVELWVIKLLFVRDNSDRKCMLEEEFQVKRGKNQ